MAARRQGNAALDILANFIIPYVRDTTRDNQAGKSMSLKFTVGDLTIHRIIEQETTFLPALEMLPGLTPELLAENRAWMQKAGALDAKDVLILCFQSYVVKTPHHTILVDSCIGNDKPRPLRPKWNMKTDDTYMSALAAAGFSVDDIDYVMCTHLHVDHVGWNTRLENGRWVPTFPKARYVFGKTEFDYWTETAREDASAAVCRQRAAGRRGQAGRDRARRLRDRRPCRILPTPGHTPGHVAFAFGRGKDRRRGHRRPDALAAADALSGTVARNSTSIRRRRPRRGGASWSAIATPTRCAAPRISPRPSTGRIRRSGNGFSCEQASVEPIPPSRCWSVELVE